MFIEVNEVGRYTTNEKNSNGDYIYKQVIEGKILVNTDTIRCVSISGFEWKDKDNFIVDEDKIRYCIYFDKDRSVYIDIESYEKIKNLVITNKEPLYEKV